MFCIICDEKSKKDSVFCESCGKPENVNCTVRIVAHMEDAERKAWDSLARYKFQMFGYWAAIWVHLNRIGKFKKPNPWRTLVKFSKQQISPSPRSLSKIVACRNCLGFLNVDEASECDFCDWIGHEACESSHNCQDDPTKKDDL